MPTFPTTDAPTTHCDDPGDDPSLFRPDVKKAIDNLAEIRQARGDADGLCPLVGGKVPITNIPTGTDSTSVMLGSHNFDTSYEPKNTNIQAHIAVTSGNPHGATAAQVGADITISSVAAAPLKTVLVDNDKLAILDSATGYTLKGGLWSAIKSTMKTYLDQIYSAVNHTHPGYAGSGEGVTGGNNHDHSGGDGAQIQYSSLGGSPALGTSAAKNVAPTGNATSNQVVLGADTRLSDSRAPTTHTHTEAQIDDGNILCRRAGDEVITGTWNYNGGVLTLNNGTSNAFVFGAGNQNPSYNTRSPGTKIVLLGTVGATELDYAIGKAPGTMWFSMPSTGEMDFLCSDGVGALVQTLMRLLASKLAVNVPLEVNPAAGSDGITITQTGAGNALKIQDVAGDTTPMLIDGTGVTVFGHTESMPTGLGFANERVQNHSAANGPSFASTAWGTNIQSGAQIILSHSKSGTIGMHEALSDDDIIGQIRAAGSDGAAFNPSSRIEFAVDGMVGPGVVPGKITLKVSNAIGQQLTAMGIRSNGDVQCVANIRGASVSAIEQTLIDAAVVVWDMESGANAVLTLVGNNRTLSPVNLPHGALISLQVIQGPAGNRTIGTWNSVSWLGGTAPVLSTVAGHWDRFVFYSDGSSLDEVSRSLNHSGAFPLADFSYAVGSGVGPVSTTFTNLSTGQVSQTWDFGDGSPTSNALNPIHEFPSSGTFTVTLTATGQGGQVSISSKAVTIVQPVFAQFSVDSLSGPAPLTINTINTSAGSPTSHDWNWGDGSAHSTLASPSHIYPTDGTYLVTLTETKGAQVNSTSRNIVVTAATVTASFTTDKVTGAVSLAIQTTNTSTGGTSRVWVWGDGTANSTATSPSHTYTTAGTYTITLTETGPSGTDVFSIVVTATSAASPVPSIMYSTLASKANPLTLDGKTFTTVDGLYIFVPNQANVASLDFYFDAAVPTNPTGTYFRRESIAPYDLMGEVVGQAGVPAPWAPNTLSNDVHTLSVRATMTDASTSVSVATFTVNVPVSVGVPQSIVSPLGWTRTLAFNDEFDSGALDDFDRTKWYPNYDGGSTRSWATPDLVTYPTGYNGYHFWADKNFNGGGVIAAGNVYNPYSRVGSVLRIKTQELVGAQYTDYKNLLVSQGHLVPPRLWGTGYLCTLGKFTASHYYVEARIRIPNNRGAWPAFWAMTFSTASGQGFRPERDYMEFLGGGASGAGSSISSRWTSSLHLSGESGGGTLYHTQANIADGTWHTIAWDEDTVNWGVYIDGVKVHGGLVTPSMATPYHIILTMQVGGQWPTNDYKNAGGSASNDYSWCDAGPYYYEIDHVRAYTGLNTGNSPVDQAPWPTGTNLGTSVVASSTDALMNYRGRPMGFSTLNYLLYSLDEMAYVHGTTTRGFSQWNGSTYVNLFDSLAWFKGVWNLQVSLCGSGLFTLKTQAQYDVMIQQQAAGANNAKWFSIGVTFGLAGRNAANTIMDIAHEHFGTWYVYNCLTCGLTNWINAFRNAVTNFRAGFASVSSAAPPRFSWNIGCGTWTTATGGFAIADNQTSFPGKAYVDVINVHMYDAKMWAITTDFQTLTQLNGPQRATAFAVAQGIPMCFGEWNIMNAPTPGSDQRIPSPAQDNPSYIIMMNNWFKYLQALGLNAGDSIFTDYSGSATTKYLFPLVSSGGGKNVNSAAKYKELWKL